MRKLFFILAMSFAVHTKAADSAKLGSEGDPIRQLLFASQSLKEQVQQMHPDNTPGAFQTIAEASKLADEGKKDDAISRLRSVLEMPDDETRVVLWVWSALRELGEKPDPKSAYEVLGVIFELPLDEGCDTLAAYADGSSRYLNHSGKAIFWDVKDSTIKTLYQTFINSTTGPVSSHAEPRNSLALPQKDFQVTLLTRSGNYVVKSPPQPVIDAATALMMELIKRSKEKNPPLQSQ